MISFLAIDYDNHAAYPTAQAAAATTFRRASVEPKLKKTLNQFTAANAINWNAIAGYLAPETVYIIGTGDGSEASFPAPPASAVLPPASFSNGALKFRIIHLLACNTASVLGPQLVKFGMVDAFIGYSGLFTFPAPPSGQNWPDLTETFLNCDAQIDFALQDGASVGQAITTAKSKFETEAQKLDEEYPQLASALRKNAAYLCGPTTDNEFGSASATLASALQKLSGTA